MISDVFGHEKYETSWNLYDVWWWESPWSVMNLSCFVFFFPRMPKCTIWGSNPLGAKALWWNGELHRRHLSATCGCSVLGRRLRKTFEKISESMKCDIGTIYLLLSIIYIYICLNLNTVSLRLKNVFALRVQGFLRREKSILSEADWMLRVANKCFIF